MRRSVRGILLALLAAVLYALGIPAGKAQTRDGCTCLLGGDIGMYNTCAHFCRYCYANFDKDIVLKNHKLHDPKSPLLIGKIEEGDEIREHKAISYLDDQLTLF